MSEQDVEWYKSRLRDLTHLHMAGADHLLHRPHLIAYVEHIKDFLEAL